MKIAIASGKGGTGKTTLSVNLASYLSADRNVLLADLDVENPDTRLYFQNLKPRDSVKTSIKIPLIDQSKCNRCRKCIDRCNFNALAFIGKTLTVFPELCKSCGRCEYQCPTQAITETELETGIINILETENHLLVEGILNPGDIHTKSLIADVKAKAEELSTGITILDCPPGTTCPMVEAVSDADFCILVAEPTLYSLHDFSAAVTVLQNLKIPFGIVINKSDDNDAIIEAKIKELKADLLGKVKFNYRLAELGAKASLFLLNKEYAEQLKGIATNLLMKVK